MKDVPLIKGLEKMASVEIINKGVTKKARILINLAAIFAGINIVGNILGILRAVGGR